IYYRYTSVQAMAVLLPAPAVWTLATRADVQSISPDRVLASSSSTLEAVTGAAAQRATGTTAYHAMSRGTGRGVGIAIVDSGIAWQHETFRDDTGMSRVREAADFTKISTALRSGAVDWTPGIDVSHALHPASPSAWLYQNAVRSTQAARPDPYGHGTLVAAVAAGRGAFQSPNATGMAPNANLFDVRVLNGNGTGQLSDVLAGIDWVIYNARRLNIQVMNLSLGANSTESFRTDPLARAVRSAVAHGIVVVVSAGNYGLDEKGRKSWGTISSPGHEPSVITVGALNLKGTHARNDDVVTHFSSRGPTRGAWAGPDGKGHVLDHLIKPDLVAPGNRIVAAMATDTPAAGGQRNLMARRYAELAVVPGARQAVG
ncbi:MAG: S8 family serine peptidase, partial [Rubrivivax sp.]